MITADGEDALGARQGRVRTRRGRPAGGDDRPPDRRHRPARGAGRAGRERTPPAHHHRQHPRHGVPLAGRRTVERRAHRRWRRERDRLLRRGAHRPGLPLGRHHGPRGRAAAGRGHEGRGRRRSRRRGVPHPRQGRRRALAARPVHARQGRRGRSRRAGGHPPRRHRAAPDRGRAARLRRELELHAAIATIFLTAPPDQMFTEVLGVVREALGARWGFFGYLDRDGSLVAPSLDAEIWDACRVEGQAHAVPRGDLERQHLVPSHPDGADPGAARRGRGARGAPAREPRRGRADRARRRDDRRVHRRRARHRLRRRGRAPAREHRGLDRPRPPRVARAPPSRGRAGRGRARPARVRAALSRALRRLTGRGVRLRPRPRLPRLQPGVRGDPRRARRPLPRQVHPVVRGRR